MFPTQRTSSEPMAGPLDGDDVVSCSGLRQRGLAGTVAVRVSREAVVTPRLVDATRHVLERR